jgi:DNA-binding response OmpR family regulator
MRKPTQTDTAVARIPTILSVSPYGEDGGSLEHIFRESDLTLSAKSDWTLVASPSLASSVSILGETPIAIVVCESELFPGTWREVLEQLSLLPDPPLLIVTSRLADERLWAEALNLGAYDVLTKPFNAPEVIRVLNSAWDHWRHRHEFRANRTTQTEAG